MEFGTRRKRGGKEKGKEEARYRTDRGMNANKQHQADSFFLFTKADINNSLALVGGGSSCTLWAQGLSDRVRI